MATAKKSSAKSASGKKSSGAKYGPKAHAAVEREMKEFKEGKLKSGSGQKVTNPKQAIAIGLSEARKSGAKMPPPPKGTVSANKTDSKKKSASKTTSSKKSAPAKKTAATKTTGNNR